MAGGRDAGPPRGAALAGRGCAQRVKRDHVVIGALTLAFLVLWGVLMTLRLTTNASDVPRYFMYGELMRNGHVPYRDFTLEYPPASTVVFGLPALLATGARGYRIAFEALMGLCGCGVLLASGVILQRQRARVVAPLAFTGAAVLGLGAISLGHYDLWPALLVSLAIAALLRERLVAAAVLLGLAIAAKIYAVVLLPLFVARLWRRSGRRGAWISAAVCASTVFAFYLPFFVLSPGGVLSSLREQADRPLQVESSAAAALLGAHQLLSVPIGITFSHWTVNLGGRSSQAAAVATILAEIAVLVHVWWRFSRRRQSDEAFLRAVAAVTLTFVVLGKVFSPQYLLWLIPLVPLVGGSLALFGSVSLGVSIVLTRAYFPRYWSDLIGLKALPTWLLVSRDAVLLGLLAALIRSAAASQGVSVSRPSRPSLRNPLPRRPLGGRHADQDRAQDDDSRVHPRVSAEHGQRQE
jgi:hypothetical protein